MHTQYEGVRFVGKSFSKLDPQRFENCIFERCDFSRLCFGTVDFNKCIFDNCKLRGVDFGASSLVDVEFIGKLVDVWFRGSDPFSEFLYGPSAQLRTNPMAGVSFAHAELWDLTFSDNCPLSKTILPQDGHHSFFDRWPERLQAALAVVEKWGHRRAYNRVASYLPHARTQSEYILNRKSLIADLGDELGEKLFATLQSAI